MRNYKFAPLFSPSSSSSTLSPLSSFSSLGDPPSAAVTRSTFPGSAKVAETSLIASHPAKKTRKKNAGANTQVNRLDNVPTDSIRCIVWSAKKWSSPCIATTLIPRATAYPSVPNPNTICDGLLTGLGENTYAILRAHGVEIICVDDTAVTAACRFHLERMKTLVEPSGATPLAALRTLGPRIQGLRIGAIITGGNTDLSWL